MPNQRVSKNNIKRSMLYSIVFDLYYTRLVIALLFGFFLLSPVEIVFAAEDDVVDSEKNVSPEVETKNSEAEEPNSEVSVDSQLDSNTTEANFLASDTATEVKSDELPEEVIIDNEDIVEDLPQTIMDTELPEVAATQVVTEDNLNSTKTDLVLPPSSVSTAPSTTVVSPVVGNSLSSSSSSATGNESSSFENVGTTTSDVVLRNSTSTPDIVTAASTTDSVSSTTTSSLEDNPLNTEVLESAPDIPAYTPDEDINPSVDENDEENSVDESDIQTEIVYVMADTTNDQNRHTFSVDECVSVGDGSFYCSKESYDQVVQLDSVYAQVDSDGDYEIYLHIDDATEQLTNNQFDDKSPNYDTQAGQVVWHRLVDGRYQIIRYDIDDESEEQLTSGSVNHMEPAQADGVTVWQQWDGDDWEIYALIKDEMVRISDNIYNDVAPKVRDGFVIWHTTGVAGEKLLSVYEIDTGVLSTISDTDGGHVDNPRFVLVYDTISDNGDTVTKTYNPETGEITPVGTKTAPTPAPTLPDPEPTGETTALLQNKTQSGRESGDILDEHEVEGETATSSPTAEIDGGNINLETMASSTQDIVDINMSATSTTPLELTDFDLVVEPYNIATSTQSLNGTSSSDSVE